MQKAILFLLRVQCRRKVSSRSLSHLLMSFLLLLLILRPWDWNEVAGHNIYLLNTGILCN